MFDKKIEDDLKKKSGVINLSENNLDLAESKQDIISLFHIKKQINNPKLYDKKKENMKMLGIESDTNKLKMEIKSFFKYFCKVCITNKEKEQFNAYETAKKLITSKLDLTHYLRMIDQMNRIKSLILKPYQIFMLDHQKKVNVLSSKEKLSHDIIDNEKFTGENEVQLKMIEIISKKVKERSLDHIDSLLYENVENKIKKFIDDYFEISSDEKLNLNTKSIFKN